eukprot:CAMPEP_0182829662 /NCGR_PEP_ID=MMETSP0006_2-20121128/18157_1 /TAXON_ID=97485 /ORGANISM="Prymnesium parvum, Strain Texoma1" /LENGTH=44 /DNA_ID= /DNA_START= /DNA_END= /DNA_ORIENTATION=
MSSLSCAYDTTYRNPDATSSCDATDTNQWQLSPSTFMSDAFTAA